MKYRTPDAPCVELRDGVLAPRIEANRAATIPASLRFCEETHRLDAFRLSWKPGMDWWPHIFWDSDVAKVLEGMARDLRLHPDPAAEARLEELVRLVVSAQQPDGYLNTHFTSVEPEKRWTNLHDWHELYCAGHLIEAAVEHFRATGRRTFLNAACRYADYIGKVFGRGRGKRPGYPGHEEIELALCSLARATGKAKYLRLAAFFVDERGRTPNYFVEKEGWDSWRLRYVQADAPVREQTDAHGHAVRAAYLYCGMADVADATGDRELLDAVLRLERNIATRRMLVTGGIGTSPWGDEAFEGDWHLRTADAYAESCAAIGLALLERRLHAITGDVRHVETLERVLYNAIPAGISLSGDRFFYQNPLVANTDSRFPTERQAWFHCSCCPTNYCRFLPQVGSFLWALADDEVRLLIPAASELHSEGRHLRVSGGYPYDGRVAVEVLEPGNFALSLRIPAWCRRWSARVNGRPVSAKAPGGFLTLRRPWKSGDKVSLRIDMPVEAVRAHDNVADTAGLVALQRGPLVYALESVDNGPGLHRFRISPDNAEVVPATGLPPGTLAIRGRAAILERPGDELYSSAPTTSRPATFTAIPYALWQNRGPSEMRVWLRSDN